VLDLAERGRQHQAQREAMEVTLSAREMEVLTLSNLVEEKDNLLRDLQSAMGGLAAECEAATRAKHEAQRRVSELEGMVATKAASAAQEESDRIRLTEAIKASEAQAGAAATEIQSAQGRARAAEAEARVARQALHEAVRQLTVLHENQGESLDRATIKQLLLTYLGWIQHKNSNRDSKSSASVGGVSEATQAGALEVLGSMLGLTDEERVYCGAGKRKGARGNGGGGEMMGGRGGGAEGLPRRGGGLLSAVATVALAPLSLVKAVGSAAASAEVPATLVVEGHDHDRGVARDDGTTEGGSRTKNGIVATTKTTTATTTAGDQWVEFLLRQAEDDYYDDEGGEGGNGDDYDTSSVSDTITTGEGDDEEEEDGKERTEDKGQTFSQFSPL